MTEAVSSAIQAVLDGRWAAVRDNARQQLTADLFEPADHLSITEHRDRTRRQIAALAATGVPAHGFGRAYGGLGDPGASVVAVEMLGFADLSLMVKAGVQWGLFGGAIQALGTRRHHAAYLPDTITGELLGCFAMTETGHGSDVAAIRTVAAYDPASGEFVVTTPDVDARKDYIGGAAVDARLAVVFAQLVTGGQSHGVHALVVPLRGDDGKPLPGIRIEDCGAKAGLGGVDNGRIWFDRVRVPQEALLDRFGTVAADGTYSSPIANPSRRFFTMLGTLVRGRISVAAAAGSATKLALTIAIRYADSRRQFARPGGEEVVLLDYLTHQRRLLPALATTYALQFAQEDLVRHLVEGHGQAGTAAGAVASADEVAQRELETRAAGVKAIASWHASATVQAAREACGGAGYLSDSRLPGLKADLDVFTTFEGDNTVLLQLVAKGLLTGYRSDFEALDTLGTVRFVADGMLDALLERTAARTLAQRIAEVTPGRESDADLGDRDWQRRMFQDRERHLVEGAARRLRRAGSRADGGSDGEAAFEVFNHAGPHLLSAARAHVHAQTLDAFVAGIERCADPAAAQLLSRVCDLYALSSIEQDAAWFLEHGRITAARARAITRRVDLLCAQVRPEARTLVDGFGIPESWLASSLVT